MIDRTHRLSVTRHARLLALSRASVYYTPAPVPEADLALMRRIDELHLELPFTGSRRHLFELVVANAPGPNRGTSSYLRQLGGECQLWLAQSLAANTLPCKRLDVAKLLGPRSAYTIYRDGTTLDRP
jgi:hypothetical protein